MSLLLKSVWVGVCSICCPKHPNLSKIAFKSTRSPVIHLSHSIPENSTSLIILPRGFWKVKNSPNAVTSSCRLINKSKQWFSTDRYFFHFHFSRLADLSGILKGLFRNEDNTEAVVRAFLGRAEGMQHASILSCAQHLEWSIRKTKTADGSQSWWWRPQISKSHLFTQMANLWPRPQKQLRLWR